MKRRGDRAYRYSSVGLFAPITTFLGLSRNEREGNNLQTDYIESRGLLTLTYHVGQQFRR